MSVNPTRRTFVSSILSLFGFVASMGRTPRAEASAAPVPELPIPTDIIPRILEPPMDCTTHVYDPQIMHSQWNSTTYTYDCG